MRKVFTLLGFLAIVVTMALCSFSASAKEKPEYTKSVNCVMLVSRETVDNQFTLVKCTNKQKFDPNISKSVYVVCGHAYNDPYLVRSAQWLKVNNERAKARCPDFSEPWLIGYLT